MRSCPRCRSVYVGNAEFCGVDGERVVDSSNDPLIGCTIDRYSIKERLGQGGMASVYRATHEVLGRDQAIKLLHGEMAGDRGLTERFKREAKVMARIDHPNVVQVVDFGVTPEGLHFLVMELLHGRTLQQILKDEGGLAPSRAAKLLKQIAAGLSVAHEVGFIHRDLKPANVMVVEDNGEEIPKILDFGLVRIGQDDDENDEITRERLTRTGVTMGTLQYMGPSRSAAVRRLRDRICTRSAWCSTRC
jgi:serine/threonine protein kinase